MTSRNATSFLPRTDAGHALARRRHKLRDWATLALFGPLNAPFLLRSLRGGSKASKRLLLDRLDLPQDALPHLGSWKADTGLLTLLVDHILKHKPKRVVEFGAGASSLIIARALQMAGGGEHIAFDQHPEFVEATRAWLGEYGLSADFRAVPLVPAPSGWEGMWYDHGPLPEEVDLMLIDGPCWTIHPFTRGAAGTLFGHISPGGTVLLDDGARMGERVVAGRWRKAWPDFTFELVHSGTKGTLVGKRQD